MNSQILIHILIQVIGGLGLFLLGMKNLSEGIQASAGERLRRLLNAVTDNRIIACGVGTAITSLIQSSSVTTVMVISMVNAGLLNLRQAIGVIMGTNIGTTVTAWLVASNLIEWGLPILGVSAMIYLFSKNEKVQFIALIVLGLGMVFFGLDLMTKGMIPLRDHPSFIQLMIAFEPHSLWGLIKCILIGTLLTSIVQSSSATIAVTITLAGTQAISFETAVALVLGQNIGTTITAFLASLGTNTSARRAACAHILFNVIGVIVMIPLFKYYLALINLVIGETTPIAVKIALSHTFFNVFVVLVLLPLINPYTKLIEILVPGKKIKEKNHLTFIDVRMFDTPALAIEQSYREITLMGENIHKMMDWLRTALTADHGNHALENRIFHREEIFDHIQNEIILFIDKLLSGNLSHAVTAEARIQVRLADEYESISDYIVAVLKLLCRMRNNQIKFNPDGKEELVILHDSIGSYLDLVLDSIKNNNRDILLKSRTLCRRIVHQIKDTRANHLQRLENKEVTPQLSLIFMDLLSSYRRVIEHGLNIAEAWAGEK